MKTQMEVEIQLYSFFNLGARYEWLVNAKPRPISLGKRPGTILQEAEWAPGPERTVAKNVSPTGIRSPDRQAHIKSLYSLRYILFTYTLHIIITIEGDKKPEYLGQYSDHVQATLPSNRVSIPNKPSLLQKTSRQALGPI